MALYVSGVVAACQLLQRGNFIALRFQQSD